MPPVITSIKNTSSTSVSVTWDPIAPEHARGMLLGYQIYLVKDIESGGEWKNITVDNTSKHIRGLEKFTTYDLQVAAFTKPGNGKPTRSHSITTDEDSEYKNRLAVSWVVIT